MFKVKPDVIEYIPMVEIRCPFGHEQVDPLSDTEDTWECCECGMEFEITGV